MSRVLIFDTTLRDGEQSPGATMTTPEKLQMAQQLDRLGVDVLEAGFPISSPDEFSAVQRIAAEVRRPVIAALARATDLDVERAAAALEHAARARIHVFLATSGIHLDHKLGISEDECIDRIGNALTTARRYVDDVEFSAEDATRTDRAFLCRAVQTAVDAGATTVNIPDTVGCTCPDEYRGIVEMLLASVRRIESVALSVHCHNDLGLAVANSIAAVQAGARQIECTINGIGERAGNASLEEIVMAFAVRQDLLPFATGIRTEEIYRSSKLFSSLTGIYPQPNKAIVGRNAFAHEAGIHQAGVIRHPGTYEIMRPEQVGVPESTLVLGKHSGRHAIGKRCRELGYELDEDALRRVYQRVIDIAEKKRYVLDEDLLAVLQTGAVTDTGQRFELVSLEVTCGGSSSIARVQLTDSIFPTQEAEAEGNGPLAAAFAAVDQLVDIGVTVEDMTIIPATSGGDAVGKVHLKASVEGRSFTGRGASTDIVLAAVQAYLHIINKAVRFGVARPHAFEFAHNFWGV